MIFFRLGSLLQNFNTPLSLLRGIDRRDVALVSTPGHPIVEILHERMGENNGRKEREKERWLIRWSCRYQMKLASRPILTQSITTAVLFATGDVMAQQLVEKKGVKKHDMMRTGRMALYGGGQSSRRMLISSPSPMLIIYNNSCLRSSCNSLVQIPPTQDRPSQQEPRDRRPCCMRPARLRAHQPIHLPQQHGDHGGLFAQGEAG